MMNKEISYKIITLLGLLAILAVAWEMDVFLTYQSKLASASFKIFRFFGLSAACALLLIALWFGLGWLALFKIGYSRLIWITFLVVGLIWTLGMYFYFIIPWHDVRNAIADILSARPAMVRSTGMVIIMLGLLNLALRSRARLGD